MKDAFYDTIIFCLAAELPEDLFAFYVSVQVAGRSAKEIFIRDRDEFLDEVDEHPLFKEFWKHIQERYPEKQAYFQSLTNDEMPYERNWIERSYYWTIFGSDFQNMHEEERTRYKDELKTLRSNVYQAILEREAQRLDCHVSEVKPVCAVLALSQGGNEESKLADLPDEIIVKVMSLLDTVDIFRVTLVSSGWKGLVHSNLRMLRRVEHAKTTHLLTFTDWMDPSKTTSYKDSVQKYQRFSLGLIQWCIGITNNLEMVILHHDISDVEVATLLQSCPNLKNLHLRCGITYEELEEDIPLHLEVPLPRLEFYYCPAYYGYGSTDLDEQVLLACNALHCFGGSVTPSRILEDNARNRMKHIFQNLIVLDLNKHTLQVLEVLADIDDLQLKYLGLGTLITCGLPNQDISTTDVRQRSLLTRIFTKLKMLEILKANESGSITKSIIKLLIQLKMKLKFAVLEEDSTCTPHFNEAGERDNWTPDVLADFGQMLLATDPELDMSQICLNVTTRTLRHDLQELNVGFTVWHREDYRIIHDHDINLNNVHIRRYLGIDF